VGCELDLTVNECYYTEKGYDNVLLCLSEIEGGRVGEGAWRSSDEVSNW
jgi:hypothetical protein